MADEADTAAIGVEDRQVVRDRIERAVSLAQRTAKRSANTGATVVRTVASVRDEIAQRQRSKVFLVREIASRHVREVAYAKASYRRLAVQLALLKLAVLFYRYRWPMLKLLAFVTAVLLVVRYWHDIVDSIRVLVEWFLDQIKSSFPGQPTEGPEG